MAALGPYFAVEAHDPRTGMQGPWRPLGALLGSPDALNARIADVRASLAAAARRPPEAIEFRAAASVAQLGLAARLISPALGAAAIGAVLPIDPAEARWIPALGGPFRLSLPETAFRALPSPGGTADTDSGAADGDSRTADGDSRTADGGRVHDLLGSPDGLFGLLEGPICSLVEMTASMAISRRVLWGNVASAINGAASMIAAARPGLTAETADVSSALLRFPALAGSYQGRPVTSFRRRSCCLIYLIYRMADRLPAEYCGDCILGGFGAA